MVCRVSGLPEEDNDPPKYGTARSLDQAAPEARLLDPPLSTIHSRACLLPLGNVPRHPDKTGMTVFSR